MILEREKCATVHWVWRSETKDCVTICPMTRVYRETADRIWYSPEYHVCFKPYPAHNTKGSSTPAQWPPYCVKAIRCHQKMPGATIVFLCINTRSRVESPSECSQTTCLGHGHAGSQVWTKCHKKPLNNTKGSRGSQIRSETPRTLWGKPRKGSKVWHILRNHSWDRLNVRYSLCHVESN